MPRQQLASKAPLKKRERKYTEWWNELAWGVKFFVMSFIKFIWRV